MVVSEKTFEQVALEDSNNRWELIGGELFRKPSMTAAHNHCIRELRDQLTAQLDRKRYRVDQNAAHLRSPGGSSCVPDITVLPRELEREALRDTTGLETYRQPVPFVAEVWSASTGGYDRTVKLDAYRARGDAEIWLLHPRQRFVQGWVRRADGDYEAFEQRNGGRQIASLPGVMIDFPALFDE